MLGPVGEGTALVLAGLASVLIAALLGAVDMVLERVSEGTAERIGADLRARTFDHAITRSLRWHEAHASLSWLPSGTGSNDRTTTVPCLLPRHGA